MVHLVVRNALARDNLRFNTAVAGLPACASALLSKTLRYTHNRMHIPNVPPNAPQRSPGRGYMDRHWHLTSPNPKCNPRTRTRHTRPQGPQAGRERLRIWFSGFWVQEHDSQPSMHRHALLSEASQPGFCLSSAQDNASGRQFLPKPAKGAACKAQRAIWQLADS